MNLEESKKDVYDLIAEFARAGNPSISEKEIEKDFVSPFENTRFDYEMEIPVKPPIQEQLFQHPNPQEFQQPIHQTSEKDNLAELNLKFELLSEQFKETQKQIQKIKQIFSLNEPVVETPPHQEYYHKEFQALSAKLNEVFVSNYKQIETKFESLQAEMLHNRHKGDSLAIDQTKIMNAFKIQFSQIQALKEKLENVKDIFVERTGTKDTSITKEDLKAEFEQFTNTHIQQFNEHVQRKEQELRIAHEQQPIAQKQESSNITKNGFPVWLVWLNVFILGLMSMYLLNQLVQSSKSEASGLPANVPIQNQPVPAISNEDVNNEMPIQSNDSTYVKSSLLERVDSLNEAKDAAKVVLETKPQLVKKQVLTRTQISKPNTSKPKENTQEPKIESEEPLVKDETTTLNNKLAKPTNSAISNSEVNQPQNDTKEVPITFGAD